MLFMGYDNQDSRLRTSLRTPEMYTYSRMYAHLFVRIVELCGIHVANNFRSFARALRRYYLNMHLVGHVRGWPEVPRPQALILSLVVHLRPSSWVAIPEWRERVSSLPLKTFAAS